MNSSHLSQNGGISMSLPAATHNASSNGNSSGVASAATTKSSSLEQLMHRLVEKVAAQNVSPDVAEKKRAEFVAKSYNYLSKVISSDSFTPSYDSFELVEKTKKKRNLNWILE